MKTSVHIRVFFAGLMGLGLAGGPAFGQGRLLLKSGFEGDVRVTQDMSDIVGVDPDSGGNWEATPAWIESSRDCKCGIGATDFEGGLTR